MKSTVEVIGRPFSGRRPATSTVFEQLRPDIIARAHPQPQNAELATARVTITCWPIIARRRPIAFCIVISRQKQPCARVVFNGFKMPSMFTCVQALLLVAAQENVRVAAACSAPNKSPSFFLWPDSGSKLKYTSAQGPAWTSQP